MTNRRSISSPLRPESQLRLLDGGRRPDWKLSEKNRAAGRRGIAQARAALALSTPPIEFSEAS